MNSPIDKIKWVTLQIKMFIRSSERRLHFVQALQHFRLLCNTVFIPASLLSSLSAMRMYLIAAGSAVTLSRMAHLSRYKLCSISITAIYAINQ